MWCELLTVNLLIWLREFHRWAPLLLLRYSYRGKINCIDYIATITEVQNIISVLVTPTPLLKQITNFISHIVTVTEAAKNGIGYIVSVTAAEQKCIGSILTVTEGAAAMEAATTEAAATGRCTRSSKQGRSGSHGKRSELRSSHGITSNESNSNVAVAT